MVDVRIEADCGNAPKRQVLADYTVALARQEIEAVLAALTPDVQWDRIGVRRIQGTDQVAAELRVALG